MRKQFLFVFGSRGAASLFQALMLILLARSSDPGTFSYVGSTIGLAFVAVAVADLGMGTLVLKSRVVKEQELLIPSALRINAYSSLVLVAGATILFFTLGERNAIFYSLFWIVVWMAIEKNSDIWLNILISDKRTKIVGLILFGRRFVSLVLFSLSILAGLPAVSSFGICLSVGSMMGFIVTRTVVQIKSRDKSTRLRLVVRSGIPYWIANLTNQLRNVDVVIVSTVSSAFAGGLYAAAVRLTNPILLMTGSLTSILLPEATRSGVSYIKKANIRSGQFFVLFTVGMAIIGWPLSYAAVLVLGPEFSAARVPIYLMLLATVSVGMAPVSATLLQALGDQSFVARIGLAYLPLMGVAITLGAAWWGAAGASIGLWVAFVFKYLTMSLRVSQQTKISKTFVIDERIESGQETVGDPA